MAGKVKPLTIKHTIVLLSLIATALLFCTEAGAQTQRRAAGGGSSLEGTVTGSDGKPVETASVVLNNSLFTLTDAKGHFKFTNVPAGELDYFVSCLGYTEARGKITLKGDGTDRLSVRLQQRSLSLRGVTVTARQQAMGSKSIIDQDAVRHIQPKSLADMLQLMPGAITVNPTLNNLGQANVREIGSNDNNALGTAVIVDGTPISNDANLQAIAPTHNGKSSSSLADGMSDQTTAGRGTDLRTISADNIESVEVIRGIPSVEYGNLTSGVVLVKTKAGKSPLEAKFKADPFSKLAYAGKGFALGSGTMNLGLDWSQSYADTRRHYRGYDRVTATAGYSNVFGKSGSRPVTLNVNGSFYSNVNNYKKDPQMDELRLKYKNKNVGGRLAVHGHAQLNGWLTGLDYDLSGQLSRQTDTHIDWVSSPDGVISNSMTTGEHLAQILNKAYYSRYRIEGMPVSVFAQVKTNKYIQLGGKDYTNAKLGVEYRLDDNRGDGLKFDINNPPQASESQRYRPRSYKDIPALRNLSVFLNDVSSFGIGATSLQFDAGVRLSNLFLDKDKSGGRGNIFVAEPRVNVEYAFLTKKNNSLFDKLSISGGFGISNKMPTLLYLYPDKAYFDNVSFSAIGVDESRLAVMTTRVIDRTQNPSLKPARSTKWEVGLNARIGRMSGYVNFFGERHRNEFGFNSQFVSLNYTRYTVPEGSGNFAYTGNSVTYTKDGTAGIATTSAQNELQLWSRPGNTQQTDKHGIEYSWDFGMLNPLRTSLVIDGAWFHIKRKSSVPSLEMVQYNYDYVPLLPAGGGSVSDRVNTNFRFITHIPAVSLVFTTTVQVVWYENERSIYEDKSGNKLYHLSADGTRYEVSPIGFYDRSGNFNEWKPEYATNVDYRLLSDRYLLYAFKSDHVNPWALVNFRLTKELGKIAEVSFMANNFLGLKKYHRDRNSYSRTQLYPDMYFGAELKMKF